MNRIGQESSIDITTYFITRLHNVFERKVSLIFIDQNRFPWLGIFWHTLVANFFCSSLQT
jgi:hypothetical protein